MDFDWAQATEQAVRLLLAEVVVISLLKELHRWREEALLLGFPIPDSW
jgi:hypothetical protein